MNFLKNFFEYIFYRIAKTNLKISDPYLAIGSVTAIQTSIVINLIIFFYYSFFPQPKRPLSLEELLVILLVFFTIDILNLKIYRGRYNELDARWANQTQKEKVVGLIIVYLTIVASLSLFILNAWIFDRFK